MVRRQWQDRQSGAEAAADSEGQQEKPGRAHLRDLRGKQDQDTKPAISVGPKYEQPLIHVRLTLFAEKLNRFRHSYGKRDHLPSPEITAASEECYPTDLNLVSTISRRRRRPFSPFCRVPRCWTSYIHEKHSF